MDARYSSQESLDDVGTCCLPCLGMPKLYLIFYIFYITFLILFLFVSCAALTHLTSCIAVSNYFIYIYMYTQLLLSIHNKT